MAPELRFEGWAWGEGGEDVKTVGEQAAREPGDQTLNRGVGTASMPPGAEEVDRRSLT